MLLIKAIGEYWCCFLGCPPHLHLNTPLIIECLISLKIAGTEEENRKKYLFELKKYRSYNKQKSFRALVLKICCESLDDTHVSETGDIAFPLSTNPTEYSATDQTLGNIELERKCYTNKKINTLTSICFCV